MLNVFNRAVGLGMDIVDEVDLPSIPNYFANPTPGGVGDLVVLGLEHGFRAEPYEIGDTVLHENLDPLIPGLGVVEFWDDPSLESFLAAVIPTAAMYYGTHGLVYAVTGEWIIGTMSGILTDRAVTGAPPLAIRMLPFMIEAAIMAGAVYLLYSGMEALADWYVNDYLGLEDNEDFFEFEN